LTLETLECPECDGHLVLRRSKHGFFYGCSRFPKCTAAHGAHPDGTPLGIPAGKDTKQARIRAHEFFDRLWKPIETLYDRPLDKGAKLRALKAARRRAYSWLREKLELSEEECHIGRFDKTTCDRVVEICKGVTPDQIREWAKRRRQ
jgi:ssDNA-binding Zn-finger/Zn-ribbon topoisomerase 1